MNKERGGLGNRVIEFFRRLTLIHRHSLAQEVSDGKKRTVRLFEGDQ